MMLLNAESVRKNMPKERMLNVRWVNNEKAIGNMADPLG